MSIEKLPLRARIARFFGVHYFMGGKCRGCGVWWSADPSCEWGMEQDQWDEISKSQ